MPEIGLLPFARVALQVATRVLPPYRSRFSKHQFTQPQLLAVLCLMRYEDWTFREAEVRLREHSELRAALQLESVPDYTTLYRFLKRLEDDTIDRGLEETVRQLRRGRRSARVTAGVDGTGLSQNAVSTFFLRRIEQQAHGRAPHRRWLKWLVVADLQQQILLAQRAHPGPRCDAPALPGLLNVAGARAPLALCWPMRSSIPKPTINTFANAWARVASSRRTFAGASPEERSVAKCTGLFHGNSMGHARRTKPSSRWSNGNSPRAPRGAC